MESKFHDIIKVNCKRLNINYGQGEEIWDSLISFIRKTMEEGSREDIDTFKSIFINQLGTFYPNKKHIKKVIEIEKNKESADIPIDK